jgi:hypothetical protein
MSTFNLEEELNKLTKKEMLELFLNTALLGKFSVVETVFAVKMAMSDHALKKTINNYDNNLLDEYDRVYNLAYDDIKKQLKKYASDYSRNKDKEILFDD